MKRNLTSWLHTLLISVAALLTFVACGGDDNATDGEGNVKPDVTVDDPAGTVKLSMRSGTDKTATKLDDVIYIDEGDNFTGRNCFLVSLGKVKGLGNVSYIPTAGWATKVAVEPGCGYVACYSWWDGEKYNNTFYRLYVVEYTVGLTGGVIGADVKYQKPFAGNTTEDIKLPVKSLTFSADGGTETLTFENNAIIPFSVTSSAPWCKVKQTTTCDQHFLSNGVAIIVEPNPTRTADEATVTIKTVAGKTTTISVARSGREPFIEFLVSDKITLDAKATTADVPFSTNVPLAQLKVDSNSAWLKADITDNAAKIRALVPRVKFIGGMPVKASSSVSTGDVSSYTLKLTAVANSSNTARTATMSVMSTDVKASGKKQVEQAAGYVTFGVSLRRLSPYADSDEIWFKTSDDFDDLQVSSSVAWCKAELKKNNYGNSHDVVLTWEGNPSAEKRTADITVKSKTGSLSGKLPLEQDDGWLYFNNGSETGTVSSKAGGITMSFSTTADFDNLQVSSSATWCKAALEKYYGNWCKLVMTYDANTLEKERKAEITVKSKTGSLSAIYTLTQQAGTTLKSDMSL